MLLIFDVVELRFVLTIFDLTSMMFGKTIVTVEKDGQTFKEEVTCSIVAAYNKKLGITIGLGRIFKKYKL